MIYFTQQAIDKYRNSVFEVYTYSTILILLINQLEEKKIQGRNLLIYTNDKIKRIIIIKNFFSRREIGNIMDSYSFCDYFYHTLSEVCMCPFFF